MNPVRAVCFDLDNTLWDVWPVILRAEQEMCDFLLARYPKIGERLTIQAMREARMRVALEHPHMQHDFTFLRKQALRDHAREAGYEESLAEEAFAVFIRARNEVTLYEEVLPVLRELRARYRLFTASNGNADLQRIGIAHFFERSIAAREVGALKPDAVVFQKVIESTDLRPEEVLYVGDDPEHDVEGARRAGMQAVWVNRMDAAWPGGIQPPLHRIRTLAELPPLLS